MENLIVVNTVRVKQKEVKRRRSVRWLLPVLAVLVICSAVGGSVIYEWNYGTFGLIGPQPTVKATAAGRVIKVPPGGNIQAALELATSGDIIELQAGAVYSGTITLPNKPLTDYVTIQSSAVGNLVPDKRVSPAQRSSMATITAGMLGRPAIATAKGAHHYKFIGIEFAATSSTYNYGLVVLGNGETAVNLPHHIEIDRSYMRPNKTGVVRRGIALNSAETIVKNSYIEGFGFPGEETQGICGWTGTRNVKILNNYIEGGAENIMFGGADPASADLIPIDIEVHGNYLNKPQAWADKVSVKTLFELKNSKRVRFTGNLMTNNWKGSAFRITIRNQDNGAPFSTIEDVLIKDNIIDGAGDGINILGKDDLYPSQVLKNLTIENNLFLNIRGDKEFEGGGYLIQVTQGEGITIVNNTAFNWGSTIKFYDTMPKAFVFRDNIIGHGLYGVHGIDNRSAQAQTLLQNNVFMNLNRVPTSDYAFPAGNTIVASMDEIRFADPNAKDFRLAPASKYRGKAKNGKNLGSDLAPMPR
ncbi:MAG TPA: right-handed parallel beta-helix repeat-containing protein [Pyrinomonadaceae bacterium]|nr:right-handed parallel beta-helix repeat-containing protein [Acidobacteriota bacterium]HQZ96562.1 right-handed parallel beta-helix repeat-containing protein [Pyrinomonadaceae bacterium]